MVPKLRVLAIVSLWVVLVGGGISSATAGVEDAPRPPNVLFIPVDDLNDWPQFLGGHPQTKTPNLDKLASRGVAMRNAQCAAPACNPSRTALLFGVRPCDSGVYTNPSNWEIPLGDVAPLPLHFQQQGYLVAGGGKVFHGGFGRAEYWHEYFRKANDPGPEAAVASESKAGGIVWGALDVDDGQMNDHRVVDQCLEFLQRDHDRPFFLACGLFRPHMPWQVPQKYYDMFPLETIILPEVPADDLDDVPPAGQKMANAERDHKNVVSAGKWKEAVQAYLACIAFADFQIGRVLDGLTQSAYSDNTIIVLWGDHGWHLGEKQHWRKFALWEEATRAPLIFVAPGVTPAGVPCDRPVDYTCVFPTLCELCRLPVPEYARGTSIVPLLRDPSTAWEQPALTTHGRGNHALRSERFRYIRYADGSEELYDHAADPQEWHNLAGESQFAAEKANLARWLPQQDATAVPNRADGGGE